GRSIRAFMIALPGNSYRTRTHAVAEPVTALITTITSAVANVSFSACQANGFDTACQNAAGPGSTACAPSATSGNTTITPRYQSATRRTRPSAPAGRTPAEDPPALEVSPVFISASLRATGEQCVPDASRTVEALVDGLPAAEIGHGEEVGRSRGQPGKFRVRI